MIVRRTRHRLRGDDRGATSVELVAYAPIVMLVTFLAVQFALTWHGNEIAGAVARETARVVRAAGGTAESLVAAEARGHEYADAIGGAALRDVSIDVALTTSDEVQVIVQGRSVELLPGGAPRVRAVVQGPVEQFRPDL